MTVYPKLKRICQCFFCLIFTFCYSTLYATIYQYENENGEMVFTSTPPENAKAKKMTLDNINIVPSTPIEKKDNTNSQTVGSGASYLNAKQDGESVLVLSPKKSLTITSPRNNSHIHTFESTIALKTSPVLSEKAHVYVLANNRSTSAIYKDGLWHMLRPYPGKNEIILAGHFANGDAFKSKPITIYVHN